MFILLRQLYDPLAHQYDLDEVTVKSAAIFNTVEEAEAAGREWRQTEKVGRRRPHYCILPAS